MRPTAALLIFTCAATAQFKSTVPLVVAPTTVKDARGRFIDGLTATDLVLYDNNVPQAIQMDWTVYPISLVVAVQTSLSAAAVLDKFNASGILFTDLLAADAGETAVLSFGEQVEIRQAFTADPDAVAHALLRLKAKGPRAPALDAVRTAVQMLNERPSERRRIVLVIGEKRDRSSQAKLPEVLQEVERRNVSVYWLTWSPSWTAFTHRPPKRADRETRAERRKDLRRDDPVPAIDPPPPNLLEGIAELARLAQPNLAETFTQATGARSLNFLRKNALEEAIRAVGEEVHRQYVLSFQPRAGGDGQFHAIRVAVKGRPDLQVTTRAGYWSAP
ncbi:MAG: VWA domain-containing protein [Acidobacteriia bacterium]|nr:VWA domain-containing protein [Terriglobia bacterium]